MTAVQPEFLKWDSDLFGRRIGRINSDELTPKDLDAVDRWAEDNQIDCIYSLCNAGDHETIRLLARYGFDFIDIRVTLDHEDPASGFKENVAERPGIDIREARPADLDAVRAIARGAHHDSRFYVDSRFPSDKCDRLYELWLEKSLVSESDILLVAHLEQQLVGYFVISTGPDGVGRMTLLAVTPAARGRGVAAALIQEAMRRFAEAECPRIVIITQGTNIASQRAFQGWGFRTRMFELWHHKWYAR